MFRSITLLTLIGSMFVAGYAQPGAERLKTGVAPVNGIRMYYEIRGKGEPLILLHGGLGSTANWEMQFTELSKHFQVIAVDSRGHGRSTFSDKQITYALMASDIVALMDHLKIKKANILGWSDGAIIGIILAIHNPDRLIKAIAFGANYDPSGLRSGFEEDPKINAHFEHSATEYQKISPDPKRWDAFLSSMSNVWTNEPKLTAKELGSINVPVLIIDGENEEAIIPEHTKQLANMIPNSKLVFIPGTGHFAPREKPKEFNREVLAFLLEAKRYLFTRKGTGRSD